MQIKRVKLIYFSPTGTTRKVLESIAEGISADAVEHIDLTLPGGTGRRVEVLPDDLVIIGAPVYGGRLPVEAVKRFREIKGEMTPAVAVVVYGNRDFEDSLLELKDLAAESGFNPVAGGAFIGEHSFATEDLPIASGRPDLPDVQKGINFGAAIKDKVAGMHSHDADTGLVIPGRFPYEGGARAMTVSPVTDTEKCTVCGICAGVCPVSAIAVNENVTTRVESCIRCCACIKYCPEGARYWEDSTMLTITKWLNEKCSSRKEPVLFGI